MKKISTRKLVEKKVLTDILKMQSIELDKINNSQYYIFSMMGSHASKSLYAVLKTKLRDIEKYGFCIWAHGMAAGEAYKKNVDAFILNWMNMSKGKPMYVIMPISDNKKPQNNDDEEEITYREYLESNEEYENKTVMTQCENISLSDSFPEMALVTVGKIKKSTQAFCFKNIYFLKDGLDCLQLKNDSMCMFKNGTYVDFAGCINQSASNRCIKLKNDGLLYSLNSGEYDFEKYANCIIGELTPFPGADLEQPYFISLSSK